MSNQEHGILQTYWRMVQEFARLYPWHGLMVLVCLVVSNLMEGLGLATLLPVVNLAMNDGKQDSSGIQAVVTDLLALVGLLPTLDILLATIVVALAIKAITRLLAMTFVGYTSAHIITQLRLDLIRGVMGARWSYFSGQPAGRITNALGMESQRATATFQAIGDITACLVRAGIFLGLAVTISWQVSAAALGASLFIYMVLKWTLVRMRRAGKDQTQLSNQLLIRLTDGLQGMKPLKAMAREHLLLAFLEKTTIGLRRSSRQQVLNKYLLTSLHEPIMAVFLAAGIYFAISVWALELPVLMILALLFNRSVSTIGILQGSLQTLMEIESAYWSLDSAIRQASDALEHSSGVREIRLQQAIRLENVSFSFDERPILTDINLEIPAGRFITMAGPSGAGKTTLVDLIIGLYQPRQGTIRIDGVPMDRMDLRFWRGRIGYVPQEMFLFHETLRHNVTLGQPGIGDDQVEAALRRAEAWNFVAQLPEGLDTVLGERGSRLSGGQRQRVAIARALLGNPDLLILDEATTALDPATERAICTTLRHLTGELTILAITHQAELVRVADLVFRVEGGTVRLQDQTTGG
ncbi:MAG: ABC transporter ATP-binding protein [Magnetococcales bacterium]|nr:ABC transporter ATP-binding protein [Magnetococcales bacterium]